MTFKWFDIVFIIVALIIIILSLLQGGKSEGASGAITGGGMNVFAKTKERGSELVITWFTFAFAILFFFFAILIKGLTKSSGGETETAEATVNALKMFF